jgi:hypothetical protein
MSTQAADTWLILNDADAIEQKMLATVIRVLRNRSNQEMFMSELATTSAFYNATTNIALGSGSSMHNTIVDIIRRTLDSAEVIIQDDYRTFAPRIAVRFQAPDGRTFVIQPRVNRS